VSCYAGACVPVIGELDSHGLAPDDLTVVRPSLEDAFVALTSPDALPASTPSHSIPESVMQ